MDDQENVLQHSDNNLTSNTELLPPKYVDVIDGGATKFIQGLEKVPHRKSLSKIYLLSFSKSRLRGDFVGV